MALAVPPGTYLAPVAEQVFANRKPKSKERLDRRMNAYQRHHNGKVGEYEEFQKVDVPKQDHETRVLTKKYQETKAKKNKKDKSEKAKKADVLPVATISDENRASVHQELPLPNQDRPHSNALPPATSLSNRIPDVNLYRADNLPNSFLPDDPFNLYNNDFPDYAGSLDDIFGGLPDVPVDVNDIGSDLDLISQSLPEAVREHIHSMGTEAVKHENASPYHSPAGPSFQTMSPHSVTAGQSPALDVRRSSLDHERYLSPQASGNNFQPQFVQERQYSPIQRNVSNFESPPYFAVQSSVPQYVSQQGLPVQSSSIRPAQQMRSNAQFYSQQPGVSYQYVQQQPQQTQLPREYYSIAQPGSSQAGPDRIYQIQNSALSGHRPVSSMAEVQRRMVQQSGNTMQQMPPGYRPMYATQQPMRNGQMQAAQQQFQFQQQQQFVQSQNGTMQQSPEFQQQVTRMQPNRTAFMEQQEYSQMQQQQYNQGECYRQQPGFPYS